VLELWIVRHGETDWNQAGRIQGWTDVPLNSRGIRQAHALARHLEGVPFRVIYTSDLTRAMNTASILQTCVAAPRMVHPGLRERGFGRGEGLYREELDRRFPNGVPDAEPDPLVISRTQEFLADTVAAHHSGRILCVSHGATIRLLLTQIQPIELPPLKNTGLSRIRWNGRKWRLIGVNWADHLETHGSSCHGDPVAAGLKTAVSNGPINTSNNYFTSKA